MMTEDLREFLVIATVMNGMSSSCCKSETVQRQTLQLRCRTFPVPWKLITQQKNKFLCFLDIITITSLFLDSQYSFFSTSARVVTILSIIIFFFAWIATRWYAIRRLVGLTGDQYLYTSLLQAFNCHLFHLSYFCAAICFGETRLYKTDH